MPKRELSEEEKKTVNDAIRHNMDDIFQWTQFKMALRLWRDEEGIDKEVLKYVDDTLTLSFNEILKGIIPKVQKRRKTFYELKEVDFDSSVLTDPLLQKFRTGDYIYHIELSEIEEKEHPINDLTYVPQSGNRFMLQGIIGGREWGILDSNPVTEQQVQDDTPEIDAEMAKIQHKLESVEPLDAVRLESLQTNLKEFEALKRTKTHLVKHGVYRIWCFQCQNFFTLEMNEGDAVDKMVCDKCKTIVIEKRQRNV